MGKDDTGTQDSADLLAQRQGMITRAIVEAITGSPLTEEQWIRLYSTDIPSAMRGQMSKRTEEALRLYTMHGHYRRPRRLVSLLRHLRRDFQRAQRVYVNKSLLQLPKDPGPVEYESTLTGEAPELESPVDELLRELEEEQG